MTTTTNFVWDSVSDCVLSELDGTNAVQAVYTNEPQQYGGVLSQRRGTTTSTLHADALGTTRALTSSMQTTTDSYLYDAWGNQVASTGSTVNPFRWVGRYGYYQDSSTGLVYVRARMYQPTVARWLARDHAGFRDGINYYLYGRTSPAFARDPSGLWVVDRSSCIADCEDDCATRFYPSPWNPWFVGCVAGCGPGCDGKDFSLCSYVNGWPDSYKESLQCACGLLAIGDMLPLSGVPGAVLGGLDCACSVVAAIQESCRGGLEPGVLMAVLAGLDCAVDIIGAGTNDPSAGPTFQAIMDAMILFFQNGHFNDQGQDKNWQI